MEVGDWTGAIREAEESVRFAEETGGILWIAAATIVLLVTGMLRAQTTAPPDVDARIAALVASISESRMEQQLRTLGRRELEQLQVRRDAGRDGLDLDRARHLQTVRAVVVKARRLERRRGERQPRDLCFAAKSGRRAHREGGEEPLGQVGVTASAGHSALPTRLESQQSSIFWKTNYHGTQSTERIGRSSLLRLCWPHLIGPAAPQ